MKSLLMGLLVTFISFFADATTFKVQSFTCGDLDRTVGIVGEVYGTATQQGYDVKYANLSYSKKGKVVKTWKNVSLAQGSEFALSFANGEVSLEAWFEGVGEMSTFTYKGQAIQLECSLDWE